MIDFERAIQAIERGLLTAIHIKGRPQGRTGLRERMAYYHVPGFSIALVDQEEVTWARGYGVLEAGGDRPVTEETIFQLMMLAYNLFLLFKIDMVRTTEYRQQIKTFRLKYIFLAGKIIRTARSVVMKLSDRYPYRDMYEHSLSG